MRNYIILNGKNSNTIQGLMIQSLAPITKPMIRTQVEEIDGRDGDIVTPLGYSSYDKTITIGLYGNYDVNEVIEYFNSNGIVTFSNEPDKYYKYQINAQIDFERLIRFKTATVTMHCQPFKYSTTERPEILSPTDELLSIPDWQQITNGVTVSCMNGVISVSGTPTSATEFYLPITALALQAGSYTLTASANGQNPNNCSIRMIGTAPSDADSFGNRYISLVQGTTSLSATLAASKTFNYIWFYMSAGVTVGFTLTLSVAESAKATSAEGANIVIDNTAEAPLRSITLKGNTQQDTYSGKNLAKLVYRTQTINGVTFTVNDDGSITANGTATAGINFYLNNSSTAYAFPEGTYTLSTGLQEESANTYFVFIDGVSSVYWSSAENRMTQTVPAGGINIRPRIVVRQGQTLNNVVFKIQLESGSEPTAFEKFVGGTSSPNPDFPQEVRVTTGTQMMNITGKNLLKAVTPTQTINGVTFTVNDDGSITANGTATAGINFYPSGGTWDYYYIPEGTYTLSDGLSGQTSNTTYFTYIDGTASVYWSTSIDRLTQTVPAGGINIRPRIVVRQGQTLNNVVFKLQLELGSASTTYEKYQSQNYEIDLGDMELRKIGNYQDYFYKDGDSWYIHRETNKVILNGSESWGHSGTTFFTTVITDYATADNKPVSDYFEGVANVAGSGSAPDKKICFISQSGEITPRLYIKYASKFTTESELTAFLADNPTTVYYALANPTNTLVENTALIEQLEAVNGSNSYRKRTHIYGAASSGNAPHIIAAEALATADGNIINSGNIYSKPKLTIFGSGDIAVYLNNVQMFQIALGDEQYITIDTAALEAYKDTTDNLKNRLVTGDYQNFAFLVGDNTLTFSGTVTECVVENYSRWL